MGFTFPYSTEICLFVMRNQYKLAVIVQFSTLVLALLFLLTTACFANTLLKHLLCVTALLRFFKIDPASGALVALSRNDLHNLMHLVLIIGALELIAYERGMRMK